MAQQNLENHKDTEKTEKVDVENKAEPKAEPAHVDLASKEASLSAAPDSKKITENVTKTSPQAAEILQGVSIGSRLASQSIVDKEMLSAKDKAPVPVERPMSLMATSNVKAQGNDKVDGAVLAVRYQTLTDAHDFSFVEGMPKEKKEAWLKANEKNPDYKSYLAETNAGFYGHIDRMNEAQKRVWEMNASPEEKAKYDKYSKSIKNGDYSSLENLSKDQFKKTYDNLSEDQKFGLQDYWDTRKAMGDAAKGDYKAMADLYPNKTLDAWLLNASDKDRDGYAKQVLEKQMAEGKTPAESDASVKRMEKWFDKASDAQKKAFFDGLNKEPAETQDKWWDKAAKTKLTDHEAHEGVHSEAQEAYLEAYKKRQENPNNLPDESIEVPPPPKPLTEVSNAELIKSGDYSKLRSEFNQLPQEQLTKLSEQALNDPKLTEEQRTELAKSTSADLALAEFLKDRGVTPADYKSFENNERSGYLKYVDKMDGEQLKNWLASATPDQRDAYDNYMNSKQAGDYSFVNKDNLTDFLINSSLEDWQNYQSFQTKMHAGDFSFMDKLNSHNRDNIYESSRFTDAEFKQYLDYEDHVAAGDYSFISKQNNQAQYEWYKNTSPEKQAAFDSYMSNLRSGNYRNVEDYIAKLPEGEQAAAREKWKTENADTRFEGVPLDARAGYDAYLKEQESIKVNRQLDQMSEQARADYLEKQPAETRDQAKQEYKSWQDRKAVGDYSWIDRMPTDQQNAVLKEHAESNSTQIKEEAAALKAYDERIAAGDYGHVYMMDQKNFDKWSAQATKEQQDSYADFVDRVNSGDYSFRDRYSAETRADWDTRLASLSTFNEGETAVFADALKTGARQYELDTTFGNWAFVDKMNTQNWMDFAVNATPEQWASYQKFANPEGASDGAVLNDKQSTGAQNGSPQSGAAQFNSPAVDSKVGTGTDTQPPAQMDKAASSAKNKEIVNNFAKQMKSLGDNREAKDQYLNSIRQDKVQMKAIADYIIENKDVQPMWSKMMTEFGNNRSVLQVNFMRDLTAQNSELKSVLQKQVVNNINRDAPPQIPASTNSGTTAKPPSEAGSGGGSSSSGGKGAGASGGSGGDTGSGAPIANERISAANALQQQRLAALQEKEPKVALVTQYKPPTVDSAATRQADLEKLKPRDTSLANNLGQAQVQALTKDARQTQAASDQKETTPVEKKPIRNASEITPALPPIQTPAQREAAERAAARSSDTPNLARPSVPNSNDGTTAATPSKPITGTGGTLAENMGNTAANTVPNPAARPTVPNQTRTEAQDGALRPPVQNPGLEPQQRTSTSTEPQTPGRTDNPAKPAEVLPRTEAKTGSEQARPLGGLGEKLANEVGKQTTIDGKPLDPKAAADKPGTLIDARPGEQRPADGKLVDGKVVEGKGVDEKNRLERGSDPRDPSAERSPRGADGKVLTDGATTKGPEGNLEKRGTEAGRSESGGERARGSSTGLGDGISLPGKNDPGKGDIVNSRGADSKGAGLDSSSRGGDGQQPRSGGIPGDAREQGLPRSGSERGSSGEGKVGEGRSSDSTSRDASRPADLSGKAGDLSGKGSDLNRSGDPSGRAPEQSSRNADQAAQKVSDLGARNTSGANETTTVRPGDLSKGEANQRELAGKPSDSSRQPSTNELTGKAGEIGSRAIGDVGSKASEIVRDAKPGIISDRSMGSADTVSSKPQQNTNTSSGVGGIINIGPGSKSEGGKPEKAADLPLDGASSKPGTSPAIGLSQMGTNAPATQKPQTDPQGAASTASSSAVQLGPANLPGVQITGIDPKAGPVIDPKTGAVIDPKSGITIDPKTGATIDPTVNVVDPKTGATIDPKTGVLIDPKTGLPFVDPKEPVNTSEQKIEASTEAQQNVTVPAAHVEVTVVDLNQKEDQAPYTTELIPDRTVPQVHVESKHDDEKDHEDHQQIYVHQASSNGSGNATTLIPMPGSNFAPVPIPIPNPFAQPNPISIPASNVPSNVLGSGLETSSSVRSSSNGSESSSTSIFNELMSERSRSQEQAEKSQGRMSAWEIDEQMRDASNIGIADRANVNKAETIGLDGSYNSEPLPLPPPPSSEHEDFSAPRALPRRDDAAAAMMVSDRNAALRANEMREFEEIASRHQTREEREQSNTIVRDVPDAPSRDWDSSREASSNANIAADRADSINDNHPPLAPNAPTGPGDHASNADRSAEHERGHEINSDGPFVRPGSSSEPGSNPAKWDDPRDLTELDRANGKTVTNADGSVSLGTGTSPNGERPTLPGENPETDRDTKDHGPGRPGELGRLPGGIGDIAPGGDGTRPDGTKPEGTPKPSDEKSNESTGSQDPKDREDQKDKNDHKENESKPGDGQTLDPTKENPTAPDLKHETKTKESEDVNSEEQDREHKKLDERKNEEELREEHERRERQEKQDKQEQEKQEAQEKAQEKFDAEAKLKSLSPAEMTQLQLAMMEMLENSGSASDHHHVNSSALTERNDVIDKISPTHGSDTHEDIRDHVDPLMDEAKDSLFLLQNMVMPVIEPVITHAIDNEEEPGQAIRSLLNEDLDDIASRAVEVASPEHTSSVPFVSSDETRVIDLISALANGNAFADINDLISEVIAIDEAELNNMVPNLIDPQNVISSDKTNNQTDFSNALSDTQAEGDLDLALSNYGDATIAANESESNSINEQIAKMLEEDRLKDEKELKEKEDALREEQSQRYAAAMLSALKARQAQEEANRIRAHKDILDAPARQKYVVMAGDTLESIAHKRFYNKRIASLIYEINKSKIPTTLKDGITLLRMTPRLVLLLPTQIETQRFLAGMFGARKLTFEYDMENIAPQNGNGHRTTGASGKNTASSQKPAKTESPETDARIETLEADQVSVADAEKSEQLAAERAAQKSMKSAQRSANIEILLGKEMQVHDDGRIRYNCRLGDTLRSISMRHPALKDVALWRLIAEINNISCDTDSKGVPSAELKRGVTLILPFPQEILEFRERLKGPKPVTSGHAHHAATSYVEISSGSEMTEEISNLLLRPRESGVRTNPPSSESRNEHRHGNGNGNGNGHGHEHGHEPEYLSELRSESNPEFEHIQAEADETGSDDVDAHDKRENRLNSAHSANQLAQGDREKRNEITEISEVGTVNNFVSLN